MIKDARAIAILHISALTLLASSSTQAAQPAMISDYFPLEAGNKYTYRCILSDGRCTVDNMEIKTHSLSDGTLVYYFDEEDECIGSTAFGEGCFLFDSNALWLIQSDWSDELDEFSITNKQRVLEQKIQVGSSIVLSAGSTRTRTLLIEGWEDADVPAGKFEQCLKVHISTTWDDNTAYSAQAWFAKGLGVVKWISDTDRVDELIDYKTSNGKQGSWGLRHSIEELAREKAGFGAIENVHFYGGHPLTSNTLCFSAIEKVQMADQIGTYNIFHGRFNGNTLEILSSDISTNQFVKTEIDGLAIKTYADQSDIGKALTAINAYFKLPRIDKRTEGKEGGFTILFPELPIGRSPGYFEYDEDKDEHLLSFPGDYSTYIKVRFKISADHVFVTEVNHHQVIF